MHLSSPFEKGIKANNPMRSVLKSIDKGSAKTETAMNAKEQLSLSVWTLDEARGYIEKGDAVQASEKLYTTVEEAIKALATSKNLPESEKAESNRRWTATLPFNAVEKLSEMVDPRIRDEWTQADSSMSKA